MYLDSREVTKDEFIKTFGEKYDLKGNLAFFRFGENGGAYRDNLTGRVIFINYPKGEYTEMEQYKLLMSICGNFKGFDEEGKDLPLLKTVYDYEDDYKRVSRKSILIWILWVILMVILPLNISLILFMYLVQ